MTSAVDRAAMPSEAVVREAIAWWARLQSGVADAGDREACHAWLARDPAHRMAWERLDRIGRDARRGQRLDLRQRSLDGRLDLGVGNGLAGV